MGIPRTTLAALVLLSGALAGCTQEAGPADDGGLAEHAWLRGDRWSYRLMLSDGPATDDWEVAGPAMLGGVEVIQVASTTVRQNGGSSEVGSFDARTLALRHVEAEALTLDFDPAEVWLMPPADRAYQTTITETRPEGTRTARASYLVTHEGNDIVETEAGAFAAERFTVRKTTFAGASSREEVSTYWWAPVVMNVVRQDVGGTTVKTLTSYALVDGPRTVPG